LNLTALYRTYCTITTYKSPELKKKIIGHLGDPKFPNKVTMVAVLDTLVAHLASFRVHFDLKMPGTNTDAYSVPA
jgi:hypothetical protein